MSGTTLQALIVDDDMIARRMVMWALNNEDIRCTPAVDGTDAMEKIKHTDFDLIVTDLRMPNMDGHAMVVNLLASFAKQVPKIVVHSSLDDPRLTKDLMIRGVADVVCKPTNYAVFAAKMKGILLRSQRNSEELVTTPGHNPSLPADQPECPELDKRSLPAPIKINEFDIRLKDVVHILPVSNTAIEVLDRVLANNTDSLALAKLIGSDAILFLELLRVANIGNNGSIQRKILDLNDAISRLGTKRVCEVALFVSELTGMIKLVLPWLDKELIRLRSMACRKVANRILRLDENTNTFDNAVVFSALIHPYGRVVVGSAYNFVYENLLLECQRHAKSLGDIERNVFPRTPAAATAQVLLGWGFPLEVSKILSHADDSIESLSELPEKVRTSVKLLKSAILLGEHAVGRWMPWETASPIPSDSFFRALNVSEPAKIVEEVRREL
ncbi:MAG TPA: response regulator [Pirellula sp.]|nr:response regulator [Pirellula sp.]